MVADPSQTPTTKRCPFCAEEIQRAAIVCKHCGRDLPPVQSQESSAAPPVATLAQKGGDPKKVLLIFIVGIVAFSGLMSFCNGLVPGGSKAPSTPVRPAPKMSVGMSFKGTHFELRNEGTEAWQDITIEVNDGYKTSLAALEAGQSASIGAMEFANKQGLRFNPYQMKPQQVYIRATMRGQSVSYGGKWPN